MVRLSLGRSTTPDAVDLLKRHGYDATRMDQGVADWRSHGWPIETNEETHP